MYRIISSFLVFLACAFSTMLQAQIEVKGKVFDLTTFEPVNLCNVYIVGTTLGAATDSAGTFAFEVERPGKYELVFSHIGYRPELIDILVEADSLIVDPMPLNPDNTLVQEVVVTGKKDRKWQRQFDRFISFAMGKHYREKNVDFVNPYVVELKAAGKGMLTEERPFSLIMINRYTGYEMNFLVQRIFLSKSNQFIVGYPGFTPLADDDPEMETAWQKNRERAYQGSLRHIFQSLLNNQLQAMGFEAQLTEKNPQKFVGPAAKILPLNVDNTINLNSDNLREHISIYNTDDPLVKKIIFPDLLKIIYRDEADSFGNPQLTYIEALEGEVLVYTNGIPVNPTSLKLYGYLATEGLYEMLPFNYELSK